MARRAATDTKTQELRLACLQLSIEFGKPDIDSVIAHARKLEAYVIEKAKN